MFANLYDKNNKLVNAVLQQIENHRNGEEVDTTLLKGVIESFGMPRVPLSPQTDSNVYIFVLQLPSA